MRRLAAAAGLVLATWALLELASALLFQRISGLPLDFERLAAARAEQRAEVDAVLDPGRSADLPVIPHPYVGYANRPGVAVVMPGTRLAPRANDYGLIQVGPDELPSRRAPDRLVIAVLGGSAAEIFAATQAENLERELRRLDPRFDRRVVLVCLAAGGFKQPQQLFLLEYALLLGFEFDAVVNLDGFNDLVFAVENAGARVHPIYPSAFHAGTLFQLQLRGILDPGNVAQAADYYDALRSQRRALTLVERAPLRWSPFANLSALTWSRYQAARASRFRYWAARGFGGSIPPELAGPRSPWPDDPAREAARLWSATSRMLARLCAALDLPYVHLLQPNQYVEQSKTFSEEERRLALRPENPWAVIAREGYPRLREAGRGLVEEGVAFYDLTMLFRGHDETIYVDDCCHFGPEGNRILAQRLARILQGRLGPRLLAPGGAPRG